VFRQYPNGYTVFVGEVIRKNPDGTYTHTLYDRKSDVVVKEFNDKGLDFNGSRHIITQQLDAMNNFAIRARKARRAKLLAQRKLKSRKK
jgi:hypothetical protein